MKNVFEYNYRSDKRMVLQKNSTGTGSGNLYLYDAEKREWEYLFLFSTYYDLDWLIINQNERYIGYQSNAFKVQWFFNYVGTSQVARIFSNLWETDQSNWNFISSTLTQIKANGILEQNKLEWNT